MAGAWTGVVVQEVEMNRSGQKVLGVQLSGLGLDVRAEGNKFRVISRCLV